MGNLFLTAVFSLPVWLHKC